MCDCYICHGTGSLQYNWAEAYKNATVSNVAMQIALKEQDALISAFKRYKSNEEALMTSPSNLSKFWVVYNGSYVFENTKYQSYKAAENRAQELATTTGVRFYVLEAKFAVTPPSTQPTIEALY